MKRALGVSICPGHSDISQDKAYLKKTDECGFTRIFMSMLEVTDGREVVQKKFKELISYAKSLGSETALDVVPSIFGELEISYNDLIFFNELGADGVRLDTGFDRNKEAMLALNPFGMTIELNMSNDVAYPDNILTYGANRPFLYGCRNFYPQAATALPCGFFEKCSIHLKKGGIRTAAFISSQMGEVGSWDANDGLPTLEMHRQLPTTVQTKHLFITNLINNVVTGDAYASNGELETLGQLNRYQTELTIVFEETTFGIEKEIITKNQHFRRENITQQMTRFTEVRKKYKNEVNPPRDNQAMLQSGGAVMGNDAFGKYENGSQVVLEPHQDSRRNRVGHIIEEELVLLEFTKPWAKSRFIGK